MTSGATGVDSKLYEHLKYYYDVQAWLPKNMVIVNRKAFDALDKATQTAVLQAAAAAESRGLTASKRVDTESKAKLKANGMQVVEASAQLKADLKKVGDTMRASIDPKQAALWFGANPPDLTLVARSRSGHGGTGADYLYTYMRTFYRDETKATGWNNLAFPNVGMPHVLWEMQGVRKPIYEEHEGHGGHAAKVFKGWEQVTPGTVSPLQYDQAVGDLVGYLQWMGEPAQNTRVRLGVWVLLFLGCFMVIAWRLNASFWKDIK
jgi:ubiquinol-cytochrome c reductase cytochrome c1 subunit